MLKAVTKDGTIETLEAKGNGAEIVADTLLVIKCLYELFRDKDEEMGEQFQDAVLSMINLAFESEEEIDKRLAEKLGGLFA